MLVALIEIVAPSGVRAPLEPVLIVAFCLCSMVWLVQSATADRVQPLGERPPPGSAERQAQLDLGRAGERHVGSVLASELPDDFVLVNGLKLRHAAGDIDHLVIGPTGVFLLETKTMAGQVVCNPNGTWQRTRRGRDGRYAAYIGDPAAQVLRNVHAVRRVLHGALPWLFQGAPLWIEGLIVFPHPKTELAATHSRVPAVRLEEAARTICQHRARRRLGPGEVDEVLDSLLDGAEGAPRVRSAQSAQALVEVALALPVVLMVLVGVVGLSRLVQAQSGLVTVVHEAARAGALGFDPVDAEQRALQRADLVAGNVGLERGALTVVIDARRFGRDEGSVLASADYQLDLRDLPLISWAGPIRLAAEHVEWVDPFRSGLVPLRQAAP
jgi:hypothetical protein